ncbi:unnamed protein product [Adineta steineri]|uniref:Uncharacterized protein n=1 Tax=Adineta steineri TaxID=433720 RepID=A0A813MWI4_9BILA|nr:unnamed protein product [Adineta steineri]CAF0848994.1 unnamed protein product [Adineta steineri]
MIKTSSSILILSLVIYIFIEHTNRRAHELLQEIEYRGNRLIDETEKRIRQLINDTLFNINNQTTEQINSVIEQGRKHIPLQNPYGATTCTEWFGCHKGYCWSGCAGAFPSITGPEWCYTRKSYEKMTCLEDKDCSGCWRCASSCSV